MTERKSRGSAWALGAGAIAAAAAWTGGCSVLFHVDASQCATDGDCKSRFGATSNYTCDRPSGTCVAAIVEAGPMTDGTMETSTPDASMEASTGCTTNADCLSFSDGAANPFVCLVDTGQCAPLKSSECSFLIPPAYDPIAKPTPFPPVFIGAFAVFPPAAPLSHPSYLNYQLAIDEFYGQNGMGTNFVPIGGGSSKRSPVVVACDVDGDIDAGMTHLISDLHVPAIVAPLASSDLAHAFTTFAAPNMPGGGTFMINPLGADSLTTDLALSAQGNLWHMLGQPIDNVPAYAAFFPYVESFVRNSPPWKALAGSSYATAPMKVATVTANATDPLDLAAGVEKILTWNGGQNSPASPGGTPCAASSYYCDISLTGSSLNGDDAQSLITTSVLQTLETFQPQIIISFASSEFAYLVKELENDFYTAGLAQTPPPFYLFGPYNIQDPALETNLPGTPGVVQRSAGVGFASVLDPTVLDQYESRYSAIFDPSGLGQENYYDAMYFAVYSLVGAGPQLPFKAQQVSSGMQDLIAPLATPEDVGPADMGAIYSALDVGQSVGLVGTLGPPNFNLTTGARVSQGDVYCVENSAQSGIQFETDVLRLQNPDGGPGADGGALFGSFPCYSGMFTNPIVDAGSDAGAGADADAGEGLDGGTSDAKAEQ